MLARLRSSASVLAQRHTRTMATLPPLPDSTPSDDAALKKAASTINDLLGSSDGLLPMSAPAPPVPLLARASSSTLPAFVNIPPAQDPLLHYLTSTIMKHGRRQKASRITARTLLYLHTFTRAEPLPLLRQAILAACPAVRTLNHKTGAKVIFKPVPLTEKQRVHYGVEWILKASNSKPGRNLEERLARECIGVLNGESDALKWRDDMHKFATVNRGNAGARV
ncbi:ribosomal protein S7 [Gloeophyllum trabeum ATCC 11539]|uniref:Ribosomal protein S7 n=1 Tax=Gloeophyllum trabeum (strain ATCC 11539 / FP-39264 / Madison 617) TaxID=670483 RepID=S7QEL2_GLOTA|nr:ribosomal protein S7 [Gloeophyllum trabeum ATCC 11539]EPQ57738.1 ribosomal protein S7 [Gloeophyllum trabeum ATCC 11539]